MSDYDLDIYVWSQRQAALLRRLAAGERVNDADLAGRTSPRRSRPWVAPSVSGGGGPYANVIEHLMEVSFTGDRTESRMAIEASGGLASRWIRLFDDGPSLRREVSAIIARELPRSRRLAAIALAQHNETPRVELQTLAYSEDQVLGNWFPNEFLMSPHRFRMPEQGRVRTRPYLPSARLQLCLNHRTRRKHQACSSPC